MRRKTIKICSSCYGRGCLAAQLFLNNGPLLDRYHATDRWKRVKRLGNPGNGRVVDL